MGADGKDHFDFHDSTGPASDPDRTRNVCFPPHSSALGSTFRVGQPIWLAAPARLFGVG